MVEKCRQEGQESKTPETDKTRKTSTDNRDRFKIFFNSINDAIFIHPFKSEGFAPFIEVNDAACRRYGYSREEFLGLSAKDITKKIDAEKHARSSHRKMLMEKRRLVFETTHVKKSGEAFPVEINSNIIDGDGQSLVFAVVRDITERKKAENALRESEERYRDMFRNNHAVILLIDPSSGDIVDANPAAVSFYGYSTSRLKSMNISQINRLSFEDNLKKMEMVRQEKKTHFYFRHHLASGDTKDVEVYTGTIKMQGKELLFSIIHDVTEYKKNEEERINLEAQLIQAQKIESIGTLAGGIAHDFNNILSPIIIHSEMIMDDLDLDSPLQEDAKAIYDAGKRARDLVKQILTMARKRSEEKILLKSSIIIKDAIKFLRSTIPTTIDIRYYNKTVKDTVLADPTLLNQIVMNLCTNAAHAMRESGGLLEITLSNKTIEYNRMNGINNLSPGKYLEISVKDTGTGISPEIIDIIFEPYFTTKEPGEGTGLGLAIINGIVQNYGGGVSVQSRPGKGSAFYVHIPLAEIESPNKDNEVHELPKGNERILFIDDELPTVNVMRRMLEKLGYSMTATKSSIEASKIFRAGPDSFDLVITDMTMPDMTGKELSMELRAVRSDIPIILCTGFSDQIDENEARERGINAFIIKPIVMSEIATTIRNVLEKTKKSLH